MAKRKLYKVLPSKEGGWDVKAGTRTLSHHRTQRMAIKKAAQSARGHKPAQVRIWKKGGGIDHERTYGQDPEKYPG